MKIIKCQFCGWRWDEEEHGGFCKLGKFNVCESCHDNHNADDFELTCKCSELQQRNRELEEALELIKQHSHNPMKSLTMLGLEEITDANHKIAEEVLREN